MCPKILWLIAAHSVAVGAILVTNDQAFLELNTTKDPITSFSCSPAACQLIALKKQPAGQSDQATDQK